MPTSMNRSGNSDENFARPVPSFIAAVMATTSSLSFASRTSASENTFVYFGAALLDARGLPVRMSKGLMPWNMLGFFSAGP